MGRKLTCSFGMRPDSSANPDANAADMFSFNLGLGTPPDIIFSIIFVFKISGVMHFFLL